MSTKTYCDLCGSDVTGVKSGRIYGIDDVDEEGNGTESDSFDACEECYAAWAESMSKRAVDNDPSAN